MSALARSKMALISLGVLAGLVFGVWLALAEQAPEPPTATPTLAALPRTPTIAPTKAPPTVPLPTPQVQVAATSTSVPPTPTATNTPAPTVTSYPTRAPSRTPIQSATSTPSPSATHPPTATRAPTVSATTTVAPTRTAIPSTGKLAPLIMRGTSTNLVALTFDLGGKDAGTTGHVLDTLKAYGFHATFFLTGEWTAANPALVRRMLAEGHELANHTYDHPHLTEIPPDQIRSEVTRTEAAILKAAGVGPKKYLRPPFGSYDLTVRIVLGEMGYEMIWWTVDSGDWRGFTPDQIVARADTLKAGDIFVAHAYADNTGQAIQGICQTIKGKGLAGGTLSRALGR